MRIKRELRCHQGEIHKKKEIKLKHQPTRN